MRNPSPTDGYIPSSHNSSEASATELLSTMRIALASESLRYGRIDKVRNARKWREKLSAATTMIAHSTNSMANEWK
jgi:hypothetical protein